jgi:ribose transport system ATP-binding protein
VPLPTSQPLLSIKGLGKVFGAVNALTGVSLDLYPGEVHALVGENGAGKSTLSKILCGILTPDQGSMAVNGQPYKPAHRRQAEDLGIRMVMQELNLIPTLTVAENLFLDRMPHRLGFIHRPSLHQQTLAALQKVGLNQLSPDTPVAQLGVGQQQMIEIAAGLARQCRLLILDEPTAALTQPEIEQLFIRIHELRNKGVAIVYISHRMEEISRIANKISVLRDGRLVATRNTRDFPLSEIVRAMVGRNATTSESLAPDSPGPLALRIKNLRAAPAVRGVSLDLHQGEILGVAGLMGSGRTEMLRALFGADPRQSGDITLGPDATPIHIRQPADAVKNGIALLTEDRKSQGLLLPLPVSINVTLASLKELAPYWLPPDLETTTAQPWIEKLGIRCSSPQQPAATLSGGNQQKIVLARWLLRNSNILLLDEPTRGIDIGAKDEIYHLLQQLARNGKAILMVSSDLPELLRIATRIAVMSGGQLVEIFERNHWTEDAIMQAALRFASETPS